MLQKKPQTLPFTTTYLPYGKTNRSHDTNFANPFFILCDGE